MANLLLQNLTKKKQYEKLHLLSNNSEILNGISTITVNGHTNGQQLVKIESDNEKEREKK